jgi:hypothetical protein
MCIVVNKHRSKSTDHPENLLCLPLRTYQARGEGLGTCLRLCKFVHSKLLRRVSATEYNVQCRTTREARLDLVTCKSGVRVRTAAALRKRNMPEPDAPLSPFSVAISVARCDTLSSVDENPCLEGAESASRQNAPPVHAKPTQAREPSFRQSS